MLRDGVQHSGGKSLADELRKNAGLVALSEICDRRGDYRAAVAEAEKGRPFLESDHAAHPEDNTTQLELRALLERLRVEYLHAADFERSLAAAREVVDIVRQTGELSRARALTALADTLLRMGRREEALNTFREASAVLDRLQVATFPSLYYRSETVAGYLGIVEGLTSGRREEDAAPLLNRLTPVIEALVRDYPGNGLYRNTLVRAYRAASEAHSGMGDAEGALEFTRKAQMLAIKGAGPEDR